MDPALVEVRRAARLDDALPARCELCGREDDLQTHHVGGRRYSGMPVRCCATCHKEASRRQAPYAHLLDLTDPPASVVEYVWRLDRTALEEMIVERDRGHAALRERLARVERERVRDATAPRLCSPETRAMLRHRHTKEGNDGR